MTWDTVDMSLPSPLVVELARPKAEVARLFLGTLVYDEGEPLIDTECCMDGVPGVVVRSNDETVFCLECLRGKPARPSMETGPRKALGLSPPRLSLDTEGVSLETYQAARRATVSSEETSSSWSGDIGLTTCVGLDTFGLPSSLGLLTLLDPLVADLPGTRFFVAGEGSSEQIA